MHRRGAQCLAELSTTAAARSRSFTRHCARTVATHAKRHPAPSSDANTSLPSPTFEWPIPLEAQPLQTASDMERMFGSLMAFDQKDTKGWTRLKRRGEDDKAFRKKVVRSVSSEEKEQFMRALPDAEGSDDYLLQDVLKPGTFVELRRSGVVQHGVVMDTSVRKGLQIVHSLMGGGETVDHNVKDVLFAIPNFVDQAAMARCGGEGATGLSPEELNEHHIAARVLVLKRLHELDKKVEDEYHDIALRTARVLQSRPADHKKWGHQSTVALAREVCRTRGVPAATQLIVHKFLMSKPTQYLAPSAYTTTQNFAIRPQDDIKLFEYVSDLIRRRDPRVETFMEKAKKIIACPKPTPSTSSDVAITPNPIVTFTEDEQAIIWLLKEFIQPKRTIQHNPFLLPVTNLFRTSGLYPHLQVTAALVHHFLVDIGVVAPWDEACVLRGKQEELALSPAPDSEIKYEPVLGPEETYPRDFVANIRHDFKNRPVYVIDDAGAEELDDGLSIEQDTQDPQSYWIHVHVADPTSVLHPLHSASKEARRRMVSQYFLSGTVPMLPAMTALRGLSLGSTKGKQNALTFSMKVDKEGDITDHTIRPSIIRNVQTALYDDVDELLGLPPYTRLYPFGSPPPPRKPAKAFKPDPRHVEDLRTLHMVTNRLVQRCYRDDTLLMHSNSAAVSLRNGSELPKVTDPSQTYNFHGFPEINYIVESGRVSGSRQMISECMKGAARVASRFFRDSNLPAIRRAAGAVVTDTPETMQWLLSRRDATGYIELGDLWQANAVFPSAEYTLEPRGHAQIGVPNGEGYVRVTSPLRRFGDMVHHWQIKYALLHRSGGRPPCFSRAWMANFVTEMTLVEGAQTKAYSRQRDFWAMSVLQRFAEDKSNMQAQSALHDIEVIAGQDAYIDHMTGKMQARVQCPSLGIAGRAYGVPKDLLAGQKFRADYLRVALGSEATLFLTYRGA